MSEDLPEDVKNFGKKFSKMLKEMKEGKKPSEEYKNEILKEMSCLDKLVYKKNGNENIL